MKLSKCQPVLFVSNADVSKEFYTRVLGFTVIMDNGGANITFREGLTIWQVDPANIISTTLGATNITNSRSASRFELYFETENIEEAFQNLQANNVLFFHEIHAEIWGQRTIRFYDPDGHLIEIGEEMSVFLRRVYEEEGRDLEATAKRTFMPLEALKHFVEK